MCSGLSCVAANRGLLSRSFRTSTRAISPSASTPSWTSGKQRHVQTGHGSCWRECWNLREVSEDGVSRRKLEELTVDIWWTEVRRSSEIRWGPESKNTTSTHHPSLFIFRRWNRVPDWPLRRIPMSVMTTYEWKHNSVIHQSLYPWRARGNVSQFMSIQSLRIKVLDKTIRKNVKSGEELCKIWDKRVCFVCWREVGQSENEGEVDSLYLEEELLFSGWGEVGKAGRPAKLSFLRKTYPECTIAQPCKCKSTYRCTRPSTHKHIQTNAPQFRRVRRLSLMAHGWESLCCYAHYSGADLISLWFIADSGTVLLSFPPISEILVAWHLCIFSV